MKKYGRYPLDALFLILGSLVLALGVNLFLLPARLSVGGVGTVGTLLLYLFEIDLSVTIVAVNLLLFLLAFRFLDGYTLVKSCAGVLFLSLFLSLSDGLFVYRGEPLPAVLAGGVLAGLGVGLVIRVRASTGGSDLLALVLHRLFPHLSLARLILLIDALVIFLAGAVLDSLSVTVYSLLSMYIAARVTDSIVSFGERAKEVRIISTREHEIADAVMRELARGVTGVQAMGMYTKREGMMLLCLVSPRELPRLVRTVRAIDRDAFIVVGDASEVLGHGFKESGDEARGPIP